MRPAGRCSRTQGWCALSFCSRSPHELDTSWTRSSSTTFARVGEEVVVEAAGRRVEADVRAGRHRVDGLDVEGLLTPPAGRAAAVAAAVVRTRRLGRGVLALGVGAVTVVGRVGARVGLDRRRVVRVGDPDGDARAVQVGVVLVRAAVLRAGVAAGGVGQVAALELRQRGVEVALRVRRQLAEVARARPRVAEAGRRGRGRGGRGLHRVRGGVEPRHGEHGGRERGRRLDLRGRCQDGVAVVAVALDRRAERLVRLRDGARGGDVAVVRLDAGDLQAGRAQPVRDAAHGCRARLEARCVLRRAQEVVVARAARRRDRDGGTLQGGEAAAGREVDPGVDGGVGAGLAEVVGMGRPGRGGSRDGVRGSGGIGGRWYRQHTGDERRAGSERRQGGTSAHVKGLQPLRGWNGSDAGGCRRHATP